MRPNQGFTLIELIVTMAILVIIIAFAAPSFNSVLNNVELDGAVSKVRSTFAFARSQAVTEQADVVVCASADQSSCGAATDWVNGWLVFLDADSDAVLDTTEVVDRVWEGFPTGTGFSVEIDGTAVSQFGFQADGSLNSANAVELTLEMPQCGTGDQRVFTINPIGRTGVTEDDC